MTIVALRPPPPNVPLIDPATNQLSQTWYRWFYGVSTDSAQLAPIATSGSASDLSTGTVPVARIAGSYTGITGVGTLAAGTWQATKIGLAFGGTNADLSGTGGTSRFLRQNSSGAAVDVVQPQTGDLSDVVSPSVWTPSDASGGGLTLSFSGNRYVRIGKLAIVSAAITYPATADGNNASLGGLPVAVFSNAIGTVTFGFCNFASGGFQGNAAGGATTIQFYVNGTQQTNANLSGKSFNLTMAYISN